MLHCHHIWSASQESTVYVGVHASLEMLCLKLPTVSAQCLLFFIDGLEFVKIPKLHQLAGCQ